MWILAGSILGLLYSASAFWRFCRQRTSLKQLAGEAGLNVGFLAAVGAFLEVVFWAYHNGL